MGGNGLRSLSPHLAVLCSHCGATTLHGPDFQKKKHQWLEQPGSVDSTSDPRSRSWMEQPESVVSTCDRHASPIWCGVVAEDEDQFHKASGTTAMCLPSLPLALYSDPP